MGHPLAHGMGAVVGHRHLRICRGRYTLHGALAIGADQRCKHDTKDYNAQCSEYFYVDAPWFNWSVLGG